MPSRKSCGCLIAAGVIQSEIAKKKFALELDKINKKITKTKNKKEINKLKAYKKKIIEHLTTVKRAKKIMKKRLSDNVK